MDTSTAWPPTTLVYGQILEVPLFSTLRVHNTEMYAQQKDTYKKKYGGCDKGLKGFIFSQKIINKYKWVYTIIWL